MEIENEMDASLQTMDKTPSTVDKKRHLYPDRLKISAEALGRLSALCEQTLNRLPGVKLTRSDLVNFLILNHSDSLSSTELSELEAKYFDEVKFAQWAVEELRAAKARGETVTLADVLSARVVKPTGAKRKPRAHTHILPREEAAL